MTAWIVQLLLGQLRHLFTALGGSLVTAGVLSQDEVQAAIAALLTLTGLAWSAYDKWQRKPRENAEEQNDGR